MLISIIVPCFNQLQYTVQCVNSIRKYTDDYELLLVDDCSTDPTRDYITAEASKNPNTHALLHSTNLGFAHAINTGIQCAKGDFIVLLNNDTIVTPGWTLSMLQTFKRAEWAFKLNKIGMVGPVSNFAAGEQGIKHDKYTLDELDSSCKEHRETYKNMMQLTGFLSGFCVMIKRQVIDEVGLFDTRFTHGFWEDNDYCLRAQLNGWHLIIDQSTFIHHFGSVTIRTIPVNINYLLQANQLKFYEKYASNKQQKLVAINRSRNQAQYLKASLDRVSDFADEIVCLLDRCSDGSYDAAKNCKKVTQILEANNNFDEAGDRQALIKMAENRKADWIYSFDADEIIEDGFTYDYAHRLMQPIDPQILGYGLNYKTFFLGNTHYRTDSVFGSLWGIRFWRSIPGQRIQTSGHQGLHCTHSPPIPPFNLRRLRTRVKHYGYNTLTKCIEKHRFYTKIDPNPDPIKSSPEGYNHIISPSLVLNKWIEKNDITLCMITKNEESNLFTFLSKYYAYFDDIVIVDTGSTDRTKQIADLFQARFFKHKWRQSFAEARNFAIDKCTTRWVLSMDPDEEILFHDIPQIWDMIEENVHAWLFKVINYQKDGSAVYSDNVRLFRNIPELRWSWYAHENMAPAITKHKLICLPAPFVIHHYGFLKHGQSRDQKLKQYGKMLRKQIHDYPKEPLAYFHYAFHLFEKGKNEKGMEYLKTAAKLKPEFFLAHKELGLRYLQRAMTYLNTSIKHTPKTHYYYDWLNKLTKTINDQLNKSLEV